MSDALPDKSSSLTFGPDEVEAIDVRYCADGTWQAVVFVAGSNVMAHFDGATAREAFDAAMEQMT